MRSFTNKVGVILIAFIAGVVAVHIWSDLVSPDEVEKRLVAPFVAPARLSVETPADSSFKSPIRKIDFANFTYPTGMIGVKQVALEGGDTPEFFQTPLAYQNLLSLGEVVYADLTGDGEEDAVVTLFWQSGPSGGEHLIYLYTMRGNRPALLWTLLTFAGGSDIGGIKDIYPQNGDLILELNGRNKVVGAQSTLAEEYRGDMVYTEFTRLRFHWNGRAFRQQGRPEFLPLPVKP
jgi:hypothetical protein